MTTMTRAGFLRGAAMAGAGVAAPLASEAAPAKAGRGLSDRINRISQLVCNVSDLERAKAYWEKFTPLRAFARTATPLQAFKGLGIDQGRFDGYLLRDMWDPGDAIGGGQFELHLVQWKTPQPVGKPYASSRNVGWYRFAFKTRDTFAKYDELVASGARPFARPNAHPPAPLRPITGFGMPDPDGSTIQWLRGLPHLPDRVNHLCCSVTDVQRQSLFYRDVLGLVMIKREASCPIPNPWDAEGGSGPFETTYQRARGDTKFTLDVLQWGEPKPSFGRPYAAPTNLGYAQVSFEVDDMAAAYATLRRIQSAGGRGDFKIAAPPEVWDLGSEVGPRKVLILYDWMGIRYQLTEAPGFPRASEAPVFAGSCA